MRRTGTVGLNIHYRMKLGWKSIRMAGATRQPAARCPRAPGWHSRVSSLLLNHVLLAMLLADSPAPMRRPALVMPLRAISLLRPALAPAFAFALVLAFVLPLAWTPLLALRPVLRLALRLALRLVLSLVLCCLVRCRLVRCCLVLCCLVRCCLVLCCLVLRLVTLLRRPLLGARLGLGLRQRVSPVGGMGSSLCAPLRLGLAA